MGSIIFPGLGLKVAVNPIAFSFFGIDIYWYGIIILGAFLLSTFLAMKHSHKNNIRSDDVIDFLLFALPTAIVGARLYYVVFSWGKYRDNILEIFMIWHGGLAIYGAIFASIAVAYVFTVKRKINTLNFLDFLCPYLALSQAIGRWGNFINQEAYGTETNLPWRMEIVDPTTLRTIAVHPTFLYESLWNICLFLFLIWFSKRKKLEGEVFTLYMALYAVGRFCIERLRDDSLYLYTIRISQLLAGVIAVTMFIVFFVRRRTTGTG